MSEQHSPHLRSYGRIKARSLKPRQSALIETLLPQIAVPPGPIDLMTLFPSPRGEGAGGGVTHGASHDGAATRATPGFNPPPNPLPSMGGGLTLEIGFGAGEHLVRRASEDRGAGFIGVEPFLNGVGACLTKIEEAGLTNVRLHAGDARDVLGQLPAGALDMVYILFPDPWPKARHHKRRLIQPTFLAELARVTKPGAEVRFATDWADYAEWTLAAFLKEPRFRWLAERADDWRAPWPGHAATRYEEKRLGDCAPIWLRFARA